VQVSGKGRREGKFWRGKKGRAVSRGKKDPGLWRKTWSGALVKDEEKGKFPWRKELFEGVGKLKKGNLRVKKPGNVRKQSH